MAQLAMLSQGDIVEAQVQPGSWYKGKVESISEDQRSCWVKMFGGFGTRQFSAEDIRTVGVAAGMMLPSSSARRAVESIGRLKQQPEGPEAPPEPRVDDYSQRQSQRRRPDESGVASK